MTTPSHVDPLLVNKKPLPAGIAPRLAQQLTFLVELDKMKTVLRQSPLAAREGKENDAEHSWHLAMFVLVLAEYSDEPIDVGHTIELVLVHDLVEIYAGDTPLYDEAGAAGQLERERLAADRLFALLPEEQGGRIRELWDEFEARETAEARFAKAVDRLQPQLLNWLDGGGTWRGFDVSIADVRRRKVAIGEASAELDRLSETLLLAAVEQGWLRP